MGKKLRKFLFSISCLIIVICHLEYAEAADNKTNVIVIESANLREGPSLDSKTINWVSKGTELSVIEIYIEPNNKKWYKVKTSDGKRLWIAARVARVSEKKNTKKKVMPDKTAQSVDHAKNEVLKEPQADAAKSTDAVPVKADEAVTFTETASDEKKPQELLGKVDRYFKEGRCEEFLSAAREHLDLAERLKDRYAEEKLGNYNLAECYAKRKIYEETIQQLDAGIDLGQRTGNAELEILSMIDKSRVLLNKGEKKTASANLKTASEMADTQIFQAADSGDSLKSMIAFKMAEVLLSLGEKEKALKKLDYALTYNHDFRQEDAIISLLKTAGSPMYEQLYAVNKTLEEAWSAYKWGDYRNMEIISGKTFEAANKTSYKRGMFRCNYNLAMSFLRMDKYDAAIDFGLRAQELAGKGDDNKRLGMAYTLIGDTFRQKKEYDKAMYYYNMDLDIAKKTGNREGESAALSNIGKVLMDKSEYKESLKYFEESLKIGLETGVDEYLISQVHLSAGIARKKAGYYAGAEKSIVTALDMFRKLGNAGGELVCIWELAGIYALQGDYIPAVKMLEDNLSRAEKLGLKKNFICDLIVYAEKNNDYLRADGYRNKP